MQYEKPGYILVLTLMLMSLMLVLTTALIYKSNVHYRYAAVFVQQEQAKLLASSGISIGLSQLSTLDMIEARDKKQTQEGAQKKEGGPQAGQDNGRKKKLAHLFSLINRWQTIKLTEEHEGINATITFYIACEQGKIDLNKFYDFTQKNFIKQGTFDGQKCMMFIGNTLSTLSGTPNLFAALEEFLKKRSSPLEDISELLLAPAFMPFKDKLFVSQEKRTQRPYALMDLFTIETGRLTIDPRVFSSSICTLLGLTQQPIELVEKLSTLIPAEFSDWRAEWDKSLAEIYKKDYKQLPEEIKQLLSSQFEPSIFSIISHATVGKITQKMYAIFHKDRETKRYEIKKLYWL